MNKVTTIRSQSSDSAVLFKHRGKKCGFTLIELTIVISILLLLVGMSVMSMSSYKEYKLRMKAETALRSVYTAQRTYLAEHPTKEPTSLTVAEITEMKKYMADGTENWPTVEDVNGTTLIYNVKVSPPVFTNDPSGDNADGKWDLAE